MSSSQNIYGAGPTVGLNYTFDPVSFLKQPSTILRLISWLFSIVVFACISSGCYVEGFCIFKLDNNACAFGIFVGAVAFVANIGFIALDAFLPRISSAQTRKYAILADIIFSSFWAFFYFVAFCYLTNRLSTTSQAMLIALSIQPWQVDNARASIAFSFLSIVSFGLLVFFAVQKYRQGLQEAFPSSAQIEAEVAASGSQESQPRPKPDPGYQERPFSFTGESSIHDQHRQPTY